MEAIILFFVIAWNNTEHTEKHIYWPHETIPAYSISGHEVIDISDRYVDKYCAIHPLG